MIALCRFQLAGYLRSLRVLHPVIAVALLMTIVLLNLPDDAPRPIRQRLIVGGLADSAAFLFPIWAWTARAVLDTQPDVQRELSTLTVGRRHTAVLAELAAAYLVNLSLGALVLAASVPYALINGIGAGPIAAALALHALAAFAATLLGAWTSRALIPSQAVSILTLLGGCVLLLLLSMGPLAWLSVPMIEWLRAGHRSPAAFTSAFPGVALHLIIWSAAAGTAHLTLRHRRI